VWFTETKGAVAKVECVLVIGGVAKKDIATLNPSIYNVFFYVTINIWIN